MFETTLVVTALFHRFCQHLTVIHQKLQAEIISFGVK